MSSTGNVSSPDTVNRDKWVLDISSKPLNTTETIALQKGTNSALVPKKIPTAEIVAAVENVISGLPVEDKLVLRSQVAQVLQRASAPPPNLPQAELRALHSLRKDQHRLVIPADKDNCTVMMDRKDYDDKVQQMLSDQRTYKVLDKTPHNERKGNSMKNGPILSETIRSVTVYTTNSSVQMDCLLVFMVYRRLISLVIP